MKPYKEKIINESTVIRKFSKDVLVENLVWHRDREDRIVEVISGTGWQIQYDNELPEGLIPGCSYYIFENGWHRVIKGDDDLIVKIIKEKKKKLSKKQKKIAQAAPPEDEITGADFIALGRNKKEVDEKVNVRMRMRGQHNRDGFTSGVYEDINEKKSSDQIICPKCGAHNNKNSKKCSNCGHPAGQDFQGKSWETLANEGKSDKPKPDEYQKKKYKARGKRGEVMAKASALYKKNPDDPRIWKMRKDSEDKERKKMKKEALTRQQVRLLILETIEAIMIDSDPVDDDIDFSEGLSKKTKATLKKKAEKRGLTPGSVYAEYKKGLAAWASSGSRKGMSQHQWAHARVNSATPSKPWAVVKKSKAKKKK
jgi:ribosomal protein L37E